MQSSDTRLQLAIRAACEIATAQGLKFEQAIVLQNFSNVILHLAPTSVVAKVATITGTIRAGEAWFARELAVANYLTAMNAPVIPVSSELDPGVHHHSGLVLSFWKQVHLLEQPFDPKLAGQSLRQCHDCLKSFSGELPILALILEAQQLLNQLIAESEFTSEDAEMLLQMSQRYVPQLQQLPMQALHGDPHSGNVLNTTVGVLWTDWEDAFIGPIEWDLASLVASTYVFEVDQDQAELALRGYGDFYDRQALDLCIEARTLVALVWTIILNREHPSSARQARIEARLNWLRKSF